jgi:hypothetical protein
LKAAVWSVSLEASMWLAVADFVIQEKNWKKQNGKWNAEVLALRKGLPTKQLSFHNENHH